MFAPGRLHILTTMLPVVRSVSLALVKQRPTSSLQLKISTNIAMPLSLKSITLTPLFKGIIDNNYLE